MRSMAVAGSPKAAATSESAGNAVLIMARGSSEFFGRLNRANRAT